MKTENMFVTFPGKTDNQHTKGKSYAVKSCINKRYRHQFPIEMLVETDLAGDFKTIWMPATMKNGDKSISTRYELVVLPGNTISAPMQVHVNIAKPVLDKQLKESVEKIIADSLKPGGCAYSALRVRNGEAFIKSALISDDSAASFNLKGEGTIEIKDAEGTVRVRTSVVQDTITTLRKILRCPEGADVVAWAEILAAGYFGDKHPKGGAVEDAIHYKKMGAYSDEALGKILAAIVNDGTKS